MSIKAEPVKVDSIYGPITRAAYSNAVENTSDEYKLLRTILK